MCIPQRVIYTRNAISYYIELIWGCQRNLDTPVLIRKLLCGIYGNYTYNSFLFKIMLLKIQENAYYTYCDHYDASDIDKCCVYTDSRIGECRRSKVAGHMCHYSGKYGACFMINECRYHAEYCCV